MRIGFDAKRVFHNRSGLGNYSRDLVRILATHYPQQEYLLYNPKKGKIQFTADHTRVVYPQSWWHKKLSSLWRRKWITRQLQADKLDIFHGLSNELPSGIARSGIQSVVTLHDLIFYKYPDWYKTADRIIHQKKSAQAAAAAMQIIAISQQTKEDIIHYLGTPAEKITVIYQGCHPAFKEQYTTVAIAAVREKFALPQQYVLSVGTIETRKNLLTTVKSMLYHDLPLVAVGKSTTYKKTVDEFIAAHQLQSRVHFLSGVTMPELAMLYQEAFVLCYPSLYEGFGIPIIEALFSKTPVITNEEGCFKEAGGPDSYYIPAMEEKAMAAIICQLQQDAVLYATCIEKGYEYVQQFRDEPIAAQLIDLYESVIAKKQML